MPSILISGASIAGPTLAYWLNHAGFATVIVERAPVPRPGGQAIDVRGPALTVIEKMGLLDRAMAQRTRLKGMSTIDIDGKEIARTGERTLSGGRFDSGDLEIFRDDLANLLREAGQAGSQYIYDDTIVALNDGTDGVEVEFKRSAPRTFDLVIGADGLHSNVRKLVFGTEQPFLRHLGVGLAIFSLPNMLDLRDWQLAYRDEKSGYVVYPSRDNGELRANFGFGMRPDEYVHGDVAAHKALIRERCAHLRGDVPRLLAALTDVQDVYFGALAQVRMPSWSQGRVALIGDAAHCPTPFTGQGTSLALIGAFVLGRELARAGGDHAGAFARYEKRMRPFVLMNQDMMSVERRDHIPDDVFARAKNGIVIDDLLP
jgi:2-polyprenyl-6-methoxyphenol hydroxylase-like FAD-dependent oxidoreductase